MNKLQTVYIPTKVEDELPPEIGYYKTMEEGTSFFQRGNQRWYSDDINGKSIFPIYWLKPTEAYVFTPEELKQILSDTFDAGQYEEYKDISFDGGENYETVKIVKDKEEYIEKFLKELL